MQIEKQEQASKAIKILAKDGERIAGYAFLYLIYNVREQPYGLLEYVFVEEDYRKQGVGTELVKAVIQEAKDRDCYKLIGTTRYFKTHVHQWYESLGFKDWGKEFRMDF
ncbi:MAG: GNAT family N-acetyltransferase [bacterium]